MLRKKLLPMLLSAAMIIGMLPCSPVLGAETTELTETVDSAVSTAEEADLRDAIPESNGEALSENEASGDSALLVSPGDGEEAELAATSTDPGDYDKKYFYASINDISTEDFGYYDTDAAGVNVSLYNGQGFYYYVVNSMTMRKSGKAARVPDVHFFYHPYKIQDKKLIQPEDDDDDEDDEDEYDVDVTDMVVSANTITQTAVWKDSNGKTLTEAPSESGTYELTISAACSNFDASAYGCTYKTLNVTFPAIKVVIDKGESFLALLPATTHSDRYYTGNAFDESEIEMDTRFYVGSADASGNYSYHSTSVTPKATYGFWVRKTDYYANEDVLTDTATDFSDLTAFSDINAGKPVHAGTYIYVCYSTYEKNSKLYRSDTVTYILTINPLPIQAALKLDESKLSNGAITAGSGLSVTDLVSATFTISAKILSEFETAGGTINDQGLPGSDSFGSSLDADTNIAVRASCSSPSMVLDLADAMNTTGTYSLMPVLCGNQDYKLSAPGKRPTLTVTESQSAQQPKVTLTGDYTAAQLTSMGYSGYDAGFAYAGKSASPLSPVITVTNSAGTALSITPSVYINNVSKTEFDESCRLTSGKYQVHSGDYTITVVIPHTSIGGTEYASLVKNYKCFVPKKTLTISQASAPYGTSALYTGQNIIPYTASVTGFAEGDSLEDSGTLKTSYTIYGNSIMQVRDKGSYEVTFSLEDSQDYQAEPLVLPFTVTGKPITVTINVPTVSTWGKKLSYTLSYSGYPDDTLPSNFSAPGVSYDYDQLMTQGAVITLHLQNGTGNAGTGYEFDYSATATTTIGESSNVSSVSSNMVATLKTSSYTYTGLPITPAPKVNFVTTSKNAKGKTVTSKIGLVLNQDYSLSYLNNINAGQATMIVQGIGAYEGCIQVNYTIKPKSLAGATITTPSDVLPGSTPQVAVMDGTRVLTAGKDYTLFYTGADPTNASSSGSSKVFAKAADGGNYTGQTKKGASFTIRSGLLDLSTIADELTAEPKKAAQATLLYNGKAQKPALIIKQNGALFKKCRIVYENNVEVGSPTVRLVGSAKYGTCGSVELTNVYKIVPASFASLKVPSSVTISPQIKNSDTPFSDLTLSVSFGKQGLVQGEDYTCTMTEEALHTALSSLSAGATTTISIKPLATGSLGRNFDTSTTKTIKLKLGTINLNNLMVIARATDPENGISAVMNSNKSGLESLKVGGITLTENVDYYLKKKPVLSVVNGNNTYTMTLSAVKGSAYKGSCVLTVTELALNQ